MSQLQINTLVAVLIPLLAALTAWLTAQVGKLRIKAEVHDAQLEGPQELQNQRIKRLEDQLASVRIGSIQTPTTVVIPQEGDRRRATTPAI